MPLTVISRAGSTTRVEIVSHGDQRMPSETVASAAEIYGRDTGACGGFGGSMHVADLSRGMLGANGIVGAGIGIGLDAVARRTPGLARVLSEISVPPLTAWLVVHRELRGTPRLRAVFDALASMLAPS